MSTLMRSAELVARPVVTLAGEDIAQVKDVVYDRASGNVAGFTVNGRGQFARPPHQAVAWEAVHACGPDAVIIRDGSALTPAEAVVSRAKQRTADVLSSQVISQGGTDLGRVVDVIVQIALVADVVGYEIESSSALSDDRRRILIPLPDMLAASGEVLIVPDAAVEFVCDDLARFGATVDAFRARLRAAS